jgi:hypothetical protein
MVAHDSDDVTTLGDFFQINPGCPMEARSNFASEARYVDPLVRLKHDQRERLAEVKAAALRLEQDLLGQKRGREEALEASDENLPAT